MLPPEQASVQGEAEASTPTTALPGVPAETDESAVPALGIAVLPGMPMPTTAPPSSATPPPQQAASPGHEGSQSGRKKGKSRDGKSGVDASPGTGGPTSPAGPEEEGQLQPVKQALDLKHERLQGTISKYVPTNGWGFVKSYLFEGELFFRTERIMPEFQSHVFQEGEAVEFDVQADDHGRSHAVMMKSVLGRKPHECLGQRHRGYVRRFAERWGFLNAAAFDGDLFVHRDNLLQPPGDHAPPLQGQAVEFDVALDDRGRAVAKQITTRALLRPCDWIGHRLRGYIRSFQGAWGFINSDRFAGDLFVHRDSLLAQHQGAQLTVGTIVEFDVERDHHRKGAKNRLVARHVAVLGETVAQQPQTYVQQTLPGALPPVQQAGLPIDPSAYSLPPTQPHPGAYGALNPQAQSFAPSQQAPMYYQQAQNYAQPQQTAPGASWSTTGYYQGTQPAQPLPDALGALGYGQPQFQYPQYPQQPLLPQQQPIYSQQPPPQYPQPPPQYGQQPPPQYQQPYPQQLQYAQQPLPPAQMGASQYSQQPMPPGMQMGAGQYPQQPMPPGVQVAQPQYPQQPMGAQTQVPQAPYAHALPQTQVQQQPIGYGLPGVAQSPSIDDRPLQGQNMPVAAEQPKADGAPANGVAVPVSSDGHSAGLLHITMHDWEPDQPGQLRVTKGTLVNVSYRAAHGWVYAGTTQLGHDNPESGTEGWIPQAVVKRVSLHRVIIDWPSEGSGTLGVFKSEVIAVSKEAERGWVYGERIGHQSDRPSDGWLPKKVLEPVQA